MTSLDMLGLKELNPGSMPALVLLTALTHPTACGDGLYSCLDAQR
jgi:hypothetical protein